MNQNYLAKIFWFENLFVTAIYHSFYTYNLYQIMYYQIKILITIDGIKSLIFLTNILINAYKLFKCYNLFFFNLRLITILNFYKENSTFYRIQINFLKMKLIIKFSFWIQSQIGIKSLDKCGNVFDIAYPILCIFQQYLAFLNFLH